MALPKCGKCGGMLWEVHEVEPTNARYKQNFVQCSTCGTPVGVLDFFNVGDLLKKQETSILLIGQRLDALEAQMREAVRLLKKR